MSVLARSFSPVRQLADIVLPWREDARLSLAGRTTHACLHVLFWAVFLGGLWLVNRQIGAERWLRSPWPSLHRLWLPALASAFYLVVWLSQRLWLALRAEPAPSPWPDLDAAWADARHVLARAHIQSARLPRYLVLGSLNAELQSLFDSFEALSATTNADAPFQVFARKDALFIVCGKLSQLALAEAPAPERSVPTLAAVNAQSDLAGRLHHLCTLLCNDRKGGLAIQGVVLLTPLKSRPSEADASELARRCQQDLSIIRQASGLDMPLYFALTGLGALPTQASGWFQRFPPLPDLDPAEIQVMFEEGVDWLFSAQIARQLRSCFRLDSSASEPGAMTPTLRANFELYERWRTLQSWQPSLVKLLAEGTGNEYAEPGMVAGCYVLTGHDSAQALWSDLIAQQRHATYTPALLLQQAAAKRRVRLGNALGILSALLVAAAAGLVFWWRS